jgi:hypothetical protein
MLEAKRLFNDIALAVTDNNIWQHTGVIPLRHTRHPSPDLSLVPRRLYVFTQGIVGRTQYARDCDLPMHPCALSTPTKKRLGTRLTRPSVHHTSISTPIAVSLPTTICLTSPYFSLASMCCMYVYRNIVRLSKSNDISRIKTCCS